MVYRYGHGKMNRKILLLAGVALVVIAGFLLVLGNIGDTKTTITGQFITTNGCRGVVGGTLITDYGSGTDMCDESGRFEGKTVEVTGWIYSHECEKGEECFVGPYMRNIEEIRVVG